MWLLITAAAALAATILWWVADRRGRFRLGFLALIYWGATLMWLVDHAIAYAQEGGPFLEVSAGATWLGLSVVALGLVVWGVRLLLDGVGRVLVRSAGK
jgi:hypothetical protein